MISRASVPFARRSTSVQRPPDRQRVAVAFTLGDGLLRLRRGLIRMAADEQEQGSLGPQPTAPGHTRIRPIQHPG